VGLPRSGIPGPRLTAFVALPGGAFADQAA